MTKNSKGTTRTITTLIAVGLMTVVPLRRAHAGHVTETTVAPVTITNQVGSYSGSINALATKDQIDTQNDSTKYVQFGTPPGSSYQGYFTYSLPPTVNPAQITTLTFLANVFGPSAKSDAFTWSIYNWTASKYESLGNQNVCGGTTGTHPCNSSTNGTLDSANLCALEVASTHGAGPSADTICERVRSDPGSACLPECHRLPGRGLRGHGCVHERWHRGNVVDSAAKLPLAVPASGQFDRCITVRVDRGDQRQHLCGPFTLAAPV